MEDLIKVQAEMMKTFAHPARLMILKSICEEEQSVSNILALTKLSKANLSQHMKLLVSSGLVLSRKEGIQVYYRIANCKIKEACELMKEIAVEALASKTKILDNL